MSHEEAIKKVIEYVKAHGFEEEPRCWNVSVRNGYTDVEMLKPYGLFIIRPDGSIDDNYRVFGGAEPTVAKAVRFSQPSQIHDFVDPPF